MQRYRARHSSVWLGILGLLLLAVLTIPAGALSVLGQGVPTPSSEPPVPPLPIPQIEAVPTPYEQTPIDPAALETLAAAVHNANLESSASTLWAGEMLGLDAPPHIGLAIGEKLPAFGLMTRDGTPFELDLHGGPLLVNFWASWCPPCIEEFPLLIEADQASLPYDVIFVSIWDDPVTFAAFLEDYPVDIRVMIDAENALPALYDLEFVPVSILVDAGGTIRLMQLGPVNDAVLDFAAAVLQ